MPPHSSSWTPAAYEAPSGSDDWVELYDEVKSPLPSPPQSLPSRPSLPPIPPLSPTPPTSPHSPSLLSHHPPHPHPHPHPTNQPINQSTNQPINQSTHQPINQSINQSTINQRTVVSCVMSCARLFLTRITGGRRKHHAENHEDPRDAAELDAAQWLSRPTQQSIWNLSSCSPRSAGGAADTSCVFALFLSQIFYGAGGWDETLALDGSRLELKWPQAPPSSSPMNPFASGPPEEMWTSDYPEYARLRVSLYRTRDAAANWEDAYVKVLTEHGFARGVASPCSFYSGERNVMVVVHGDDFLS